MWVEVDTNSNIAKETWVNAFNNRTFSCIEAYDMEDNIFEKFSDDIHIHFYSDNNWKITNCVKYNSEDDIVEMFNYSVSCETYDKNEFLNISGIQVAYVLKLFNKRVRYNTVGLEEIESRMFTVNELVSAYAQHGITTTVTDKHRDYELM